MQFCLILRSKSSIVSETLILRLRKESIHVHGSAYYLHVVINRNWLIGGANENRNRAKE